MVAPGVSLQVVMTWVKEREQPSESGDYLFSHAFATTLERTLRKLQALECRSAPSPAQYERGTQVGINETACRNRKILILNYPMDQRRIPSAAASGHTWNDNPIRSLALRAALRASSIVRLLVSTRSMTSSMASCTTSDSTGARGLPR